MTAPTLQLDPAACERARLARDPRFDGHFFIAVRSTGIFCRTVCPVRLPKPENVRFVPSAASAMEQGYRPCLRCRPELAPDHPYWPMQPPLIQAALQAIDDGLLDRASNTELAGHLGVSDRHLRRLFQQQLGITPSALALHRRTLFAKRLISDSQLPFQQIAEAAGFGSVRRFNAAIARLYQRTPRQLRQNDRACEGPLRIMLHYRPPYAWHAMRDFFTSRAINGVEEVTEHSYARHFAWNGQGGHVRLQHCPKERGFEMQLTHPQASATMPAIQAARRLLDLDAQPAEIEARLSLDDRLRPVLQTCPGLRVPGGWDPFELCVRAVLGQQVSVKAARTFAQRLVDRCDFRLADDALLFPGPEQILQTSLSGLGLTGRRIATLQHLSQACLDGRLQLHSRNAQHIDQTLAAIPGIGPWTRAYIALRAIRDPDALPAGDIVLRKALSADGTALNERQLIERARVWQPWRAYAVLALWRDAATP